MHTTTSSWSLTRVLFIKREYAPNFDLAIEKRIILQPIKKLAMNFASENSNNYTTTNFTQTNSGVQVVFYPTIHPQESIDTSPRRSSFLSAFLDLMEIYYQDDCFRAKQMAQFMNMSETQLFRRLKAQTNHGFTSYLRLYRLRKAKDLLQNDYELNISEIAYEVGFTDPNYFSRSFSEVFGKTPSSFRREAH